MDRLEAGVPQVGGDADDKIGVHYCGPPLLVIMPDGEVPSPTLESLLPDRVYLRGLACVELGVRGPQECVKSNMCDGCWGVHSHTIAHYHGRSLDRHIVQFTKINEISYRRNLVNNEARCWEMY